MKSYTNIEQSQSLAEILPIESSDAFYKRSIGDSCNWELNCKNLFKIKNHPAGVGFLLKKKLIVPVWSLAALLDVLPKIINNETLFIETSAALWHIGYRNIYTARADNPIDACVEMITKLHKEELL